MDEFEFRPDSSTNYRVSCPLASEKSIYNVVTPLAPLYLIVSSLFLQVTRTTIKAWIGLKFGKIRPRTGLAALEHVEKFP